MKKLFILLIIFIPSVCFSMDALSIVLNANAMYNPDRSSVPEHEINLPDPDITLNKLVESNYEYVSPTEKRIRKYIEESFKDSYLNIKWDSYWINNNVNRINKYEHEQD